MAKRCVIFFIIMGTLACVRQNTQMPDTNEKPFHIGREDLLEVVVWREAELSRLMPVRPDGYISLPLVGEVMAEGKKPEALASDIQNKLNGFIQEPRVSVLVREVHSAQFFVTGEVARPGNFPLRGRVSLLQALAFAGGFTAFAEREAILLIRGDGTRSSVVIKYSDLVEGMHRQAYLEPGDTIVVP